MKNQYLLIVTISIAAVAVGCNKSNTTMDDSNATNTATSMADSTKTGVSNAWESTKNVATNAWAKTVEVTTNTWQDIKQSLQSSANYTYDKKDAFVADAQADLAVLDQKISALSNKISSGSDSVKADGQAKLQDLETQRSALDKNLDAVKASTETGWNDTKTTFVNAYNATKSSLKQAWQWVNDKTNT